jgi:hydrogenase maturation protease
MTLAATGIVLVVGYGNPLCGDDGAGPAVVARLAGDPRLAHAELRTSHQLTPELARDIACASLVVLVDAGTGSAPGEVVVGRVEPGVDGGSAWSHRVDPAGLATLAKVLYGVVPPVFTVCIGAESMELGDDLSPAVAAALGTAADAVATIVGADAHA